MTQNPQECIHLPRVRHPGMWSQVALGSITTNKASGGDGIPAELVQVLKDGAVKVLHSTCHQIWKTQQWPQDWKKSVFIPIPKKGNAKECSNYHTTAVNSHASKVMVKILQARLQQYVNCELPDVRIWKRQNYGSNCQHLLDHRKRKRGLEKHLLLLYWLHQDFWLCGLQQTVENSERDRNTRPPDLPPEKSRLKSNRYYWTWNNRLVPNQERSTSRLYIVTLLI